MATEIFISAGEVSGDMHAAKLVNALRSLRQDIHVFGMGGQALRSAKAETVVDSETEASVMGFFEVAVKMKTIIAAFNKLVLEAEKRKPALAILIDFPDFNLRLAKKLHALGIPVMYYISPQVWAWRKGRIKDIKKYVTRMVPILPFEETFYREHGVEASYVGHPLLDVTPPPFDRNDFLRKNNIDPTQPVLAMLPGSRTIEINRILPTMLEALKIMQSKIPTLQTILPIASRLKEDFIKSFTKDLPIKLINQQAESAMRAADVTLVTSGTACLEAALIGSPFLVVYKANKFSYLIGRLLVHGVKYIALPNLIAQRKVVEELLQGAATPKRIAREILPYFLNPKARELFIKGIIDVRKTLEVPNSTGTSSERIAKIALEIIDKKK